MREDNRLKERLPCRIEVMKSFIDHLVVTAGSLSLGAEYLADVLGVEPVEGGEHMLMGTHNALVRLGESVYIEAIAVNPAAPKPVRPRWFGLDGLSEQAEPRLATWVVRTTNIQRAVDVLKLPVGNIEMMSRGSFEWQITIPSNGNLPLDGAAPTLIEWKTSTHPSDVIPPSGCKLLSLRVMHPKATTIATALTEIGFEGPVDFAIPESGEPNGLVAIIQTPRGIREFG